MLYSARAFKRTFLLQFFILVEDRPASQVVLFKKVFAIHMVASIQLTHIFELNRMRRIGCGEWDAENGQGSARRRERG